LNDFLQNVDEILVLDVTFLLSLAVNCRQPEFAGGWQNKIKQVPKANKNS
jgi:hypothetical protein